MSDTRATCRMRVCLHARTRARPVPYVLVSGDRSGEQEKQMSTSELEHDWWGRVSRQAPS